MSDLDTSRETVDQGSFGTTLVTLMCKRVAYLEDLQDGDGTVDVSGDRSRELCRQGLAPADSDPDVLKALQAKRDQLIAAVDTTFPDGFLPDLQTLLTSNEFLSLYDSGETVGAVDDLIEMMNFFADDAELAPALERLNLRLGYLPADQSLGAVRALVNYPEMHELLLVVSQQLTAGGQAKGEFDKLLAGLGITLRNAQTTADPSDRSRTGQLALDLLLSESSLLGGQASIPMVKRDYRGVAMVADIAGSSAAAFADTDSDGLADVDDLGRFVDAAGAPLTTPAPFALPAGDAQVPWSHRDAAGRALDAADGELVYEYVDLDRTLVSALARDAVSLFDPNKGTAFDLLRGASALMSTQPRMLVTRSYDNGESLEYRGYDAAKSPLLDMVHGVLAMLDDPQVYDLLELGRSLLGSHEPEAARLMEAVMDAKGVANSHDDAQMDPAAPFGDEFTGVIARILAVPGLGEDIMRALEDPASLELSMRFRDFAKYTDQFSFDSNQDLTGAYGTQVARSQPDVAYNRSVLQRLLHLIDDANGATMCNKQDGKVRILGIGVNTYDECELVQVDNLALLYVQSIAFRRSGGDFVCDSGNPSRNAQGYWRCGDGARPEGRARFDFNWGWISFAVTDGLLQTLTTIDGFKTRPTPEALNRVLFLHDVPGAMSDLIDPPETKYGQQFITVHDGTLPVWEVDNFYDQIQPLVQAFADHNSEILFLDLLGVLHKHWASKDSAPTHQFNVPGSAGYVWGSNGVSYEAAIVEILDRRETLPDRGNLMDALYYTAPVINHLDINGKNSVDVLISAARYLFAPQPGLENRRGESSSQTLEGDPIAQLSPMQLLLDAYAIKREQVAASADEGQAWQRSVGNLVDVLVRAEPIAGQGWRFKNPRFRGVSVLIIDFLEARLRAHDLAGDRSVWLSQGLPADLEEVMTGPVFAGAADFILSLQASPEARRQLELASVYLMNEVNYNEAFRLSLSSTADLLQLALDDQDIVPIAHVLGEALRPERGWVDSHLEFVKKARESDQTEALVAMMRNLYEESAPGHTAIGDLIDGISEVHRARPYVDLGKDYSAADYRSLLRGLGGFLDDNKRGLRRFISLIKGRNL